MTREQTMLKRFSIGTMALVAFMGSGSIGGCARQDTLKVPQTTVAPYGTSRGEMLWAVVPLRNESGTLQADVLVMSDRLVAAVEDIQGVRCVPLNRTLEAIVALKLEGGVRTPGEARKLAQAMGVDGIVVGSLTAWDPYTPQVGVSLALFARSGAMGGEEPRAVDPRALSISATGSSPAAERFAEKPVSSVSENLDGKNHQVLMDVRRYAEGRVDPDSALNWQRYVKSMDLYQEFAAHYVVEKLIQAEWTRTAYRGVRQGDGAAANGGKPSGRTIERWAGESGNTTKGAER